jgi:predicted phage tail protein
MAEIIIHGRLGKELKNKYNFSRINSIFDVIRFLEMRDFTFRKKILKYSQEGQHYEFIINSNIEIDKTNINKIEKIKTVEIVPSISGKDPVSFTISLVINLAIAGITYLMTPIPSFRVGAQPSLEIENRSFFFSSRANMANQGTTIPVGYGRLRIGSSVIQANAKFKKTWGRADFGNYLSFADSRYREIGPLWLDRF